MNKIYAYKNVMYPGLIKIGQTSGDVEERVKAQFSQQLIDKWLKPFIIIFSVIGMTNSGKEFTDKDVHKKLEDRGFRRASINMEYFECQPSDIILAVAEVMTEKELKVINNIQKYENFDNLLVNKFIEDCSNSSKQEVIYPKTKLATILEQYLVKIGFPKARARIREFMNKYEYFNNINKLAERLEPFGYSAELERGTSPRELKLKVTKIEHDN